MSKKNGGKKKRSKGTHKAQLNQTLERMAAYRVNCLLSTGHKKQSLKRRR